MGDILIIEIDCPYRYPTGHCSVNMSSQYCLRCQVGSDWINDHIKIIAKEDKLSGNFLTKFLEKHKEELEKVIEDSKVEITIAITDPEGILDDAQTDDN